LLFKQSLTTHGIIVFQAKIFWKRHTGSTVWEKHRPGLLPFPEGDLKATHWEEMAHVSGRCL
ncbi:hypothetical protein, partial [Novacetimonas hansenii]|uniref:hypothetical protein n=1 Tax=Novacetimonas hansenii TaxID=436 RepID=UPI001C3FD44A